MSTSEISPFEQNGKIRNVRDLPMYSPPSTVQLLLPIKFLPLTEVGKLRATLQQEVYQASLESRSQLKSYLNWEGNFINGIKHMIPIEEATSTGILYVGVGTLAASILSKNRNGIIRIAVPSIAFFASSWVCLPKTTNNFFSHASQQFSSLK